MQKQYSLLLFLSTSALFSAGGVTAQTNHQDKLRAENQANKTTVVDTLHNSTDDKFDALEESSHIELELEIDTKSIYLGREYGGNGLLYNPKFVYYHKSGLGFSIVNYDWANSPTASSITDLLINYSRTFGESFDFGADYDYWIFHKDIRKQGLNNLVDASGTYWFKDWFNAGTDITYMFGSQQGLLIHSSAGMIIKVYPHGAFQRLSLEPEAGIYFGDPSVYKKKMRPGNQVLLSKKSGVLDYYVSLKLTYQYKLASFGLLYETDFPRKYKDKSGNVINRTDFLSFSVKRYFTWKQKISKG